MHRRTFLSLLGSAALKAQTGQGLPPELVRHIETLIAGEMSRQSIPAFSVAVAAGGELRWSSGYGLADLENFVPARALTANRTASVGKPMTAVAVMQLVEAGKLDLDTPVSRYLPAVNGRTGGTTLRQLLGHIGGIRAYRDETELNSTRHYWSLGEALSVFQNDELVADPGTKYSYSTYGYVLAGAAAEAVAGVPLREYMRVNVFERAGMVNTRLDDTFAIIPNRARGYARNKDGQLRNARLLDTSNRWPGGGFVSTVEDVVRFALAFAGGKLVSESTEELMLTPLTLTGGDRTTYGLGWGVGTLDGKRVASHSGGQAGVSTLLKLLPEQKTAVAFMCNLQEAKFPFADEILRAI